MRAHPRRQRCTALLFALCTSCGLAARRHPCWDYTAHRLGGRVPDALVSQLASDGGAEKRVRGHRAPIGYYWRRIEGLDPDLRRMRQYVDGHELTACPVAALDPAEPALTTTPR